MCEEKGELRDVQLTDFNDKNYQQVENKDCGTTGSDDSHDFVLCKNKKVAYPLFGTAEGDFACVADCPSTMKVMPGTNNCECIKRMEETRTEDVVQECVKECPLTHYDDSGTCKECSSLCPDVSSAGSRVCTGPAPDQCHACSYRSADGTCTSGCTPGQKAVPGTSDGTFICQACRSGYRCVNGDQVDEICSAGTYSNAEGTACEPCPAGQYSGSASTVCQPCPAGQFSPQYSSSSCQSCPAGQFSNTTGSTSCQQCPAGTESTAGSTSCSPQYSGCQDPAILSGDSGTITSPGYPGMYESNLRCSWTITVSRGRRATIRFTSLDVEEQPGCVYDYLQVRDGADSISDSLGKFCGSTIPSAVVASGRTMHLVFRSDGSVGGEGFSVEYAGVTNLARRRSTAQSSTGYGLTSSKAVDGITDGIVWHYSCTHTHTQSNPWWRVDLGSTRTIFAVDVYDRVDECCSDRLNPFYVHVGHSTSVTSNPTCGGQQSVSGDYKSVPCNGLQGRYVGVALQGSGRTLTLCEVKVFGV
ncbi:uncharacterized protein LOC144916916 [Branchiostoma floridae x Branchiostoma belcheri]